jgi:hypothetical protein
MAHVFITEDLKDQKTVEKYEQIVEDGSASNNSRKEKMCVGMMPKDK